ncbi:MAG: hypothetical protein QNJ11_20425 [Woeseiaceae bacterium]|nr:hypothetical protein [Woeseiaceae bacterium]
MAFGEISRMTLWIGGIGLVWNLLGLAAFFNQMMMDTSALPDAQRAFHETMPLWAKTAFFIAVSMGAVGCIALLTGQSWARIAFAASLLGIVLQNVHSFVLGKGLDVFGPGAVAMPILVFLIAVFLLYYANSLVR